MSEKMIFQVSAKAAQLIGRENISDVDGAIIELVKNSYDADATCVYLMFELKYVSVPIILTEEQVNILMASEQQIIFDCYDIDVGKSGETLYLKKTKLTDQQIKKLEEMFYSRNKIYVIDNGTGMTRKVLKNSWMNIGTSDKENKIYSEKGRVKTGAKGIGRFALDKLSRKSEVITKAKDDICYSWRIDWDQFEKEKLLKDVSAEIEESRKSFSDTVKNLITNDEIFVEHNWSTGTIIKLQPTREAWNNRLLNKVNTNLKSINPLGNVDRFDVYVKNKYQKEYNLNPEDILINKQDYDYKIISTFDGDSSVILKIERNEIDLLKKNVLYKSNIGDEYIFDLNEFWGRPAFKESGYTKLTYDECLENEYMISELSENREKLAIDEYRKIGPFEVELFFLKNANSDVAITKRVNRSRRIKLLKDFSGIKIYRDDFKVRPYGDEGQLYDWLSLSGRNQNSPAGISDPGSPWRVLPYQIIGSIKISREKNPKLTDMMNREGLESNETYFEFIEVINGIISKFEYDRQYIFREYKKWFDDKKTEVGNLEKVINAAKKAADEKSRKKTNNQHDSANDSSVDGEKDLPNEEVTTDEYNEAILNLVDEKEKLYREQQTIMVLAQSGIVANTFSHELGNISKGLNNRASQLRSVIDYILKYKPYSGDELFNPYTIIKEFEEVDTLMLSWIDIIVRGTRHEDFEKKEQNFLQTLNEIDRSWRLLLEKNHITLNIFSKLEEVIVQISKVDILLICNNFILNSVWFLKESKKKQKREITITILKKNQKYFIELSNNGPSLSEKYNKTPHRIFELGETEKTSDNEDLTKKDGTGLGLWIMDSTVRSNGGSVKVDSSFPNGFKLVVEFPVFSTNN